MQEPIPTLHLDWLDETPFTAVEIFFYYTRHPWQTAAEGTFTVTTEYKLDSEYSQLVATRKVAMQFPPIPSDASCTSRHVRYLEDRMEQIKLEVIRQRVELRREVNAILQAATAASIKKGQT